MKRALIVPAAGRGSRLGGTVPKVLVRVNGRPMLSHIMERYREIVELVVLVVHPSAVDEVRRHLDPAARVELLVQDQPTGMLDAILIPAPRVANFRPDEIWITWCDQVMVSGQTVLDLGRAMVMAPEPALAFPTVTTTAPYIHFERDAGGSIVNVLQRREGDTMPDDGEGDIGLFAMSGATYLRALPEFAAGTSVSRGTGERNFLPFIPWLARRALVRTCAAATAIEAVGINTPDDLALVERHLASGS